LPSYIAVLPHKDGHSIKLIEVMSSGRAVIATGIGLAKELISDGKNGFLVEKGSVPDLVNKISFAMENRKAVEEAALKARETMLEKCDISRNSREIIEILSKVE